MPRPRANPEQHRLAYSFFLDGMGPTAIHNQLIGRYGTEGPNKAISERTLATWINGFKDIEDRALDDIFEWHNLEEYDLPWEASSYLLEMIAYVQQTDSLRDVGPSVREVQWWWRVHLAAPDLSMFDVYWLAYPFVDREIRQVVTNSPSLVMSDLESHLAYRPWVSDQHLERYLEAIRRKRISPLLNDFGTTEYVDVIETPGKPLEFVLSAQERIPWVCADFPGLLPTQLAAMYQKEEQS